MARELSSQEKRLIEREFIARQDAASKRRSRYRAVFLIGIFAAVVGAALREFRVPTLITPLLGLIWLICIAAYVGLAAFPHSFAKDLDPRWHMNPWQSALSSLSEGKTQFEAIALLASPFLARGIFSLIYLSIES